MQVLHACRCPRSCHRLSALAHLLQDTLLLCEHIRNVGDQQWDVLAQKLLSSCPAALCALRWHVLVVEQQRLNNTLRAPKWYSDWELCVLMLVSA
jgi:hypothetical protein